jgi:hypothetical protein
VNVIPTRRLHCPAAARAALLAALFLAGCGRTTETADRPRPEGDAPAAAATVVNRTTTNRVEPTGAAGVPGEPAATTAIQGDPTVATPAVYEPKPGVRPGQPTSLREAYPDYRPGANDPEIESTRTGRREVAIHDRTFDAGGAASLDELVAAVLSGVDRADGEALDRTAVTFHDFNSILWPEMPQSRPAANVPAGEAWDFLRRRHLSAFNRVSGELSGQGLVPHEIRIGKVVEYTNFRLHDDIRVIAVDAAGNAYDFPMIRTVAECRGRFKLYSTRD